jgi:hypothetical protein
MKFRECVSKLTASKKQTDEETDEIQQGTNCVSRRRGDGLDGRQCMHMRPERQAGPKNPALLSAAPAQAFRRPDFT